MRSLIPSISGSSDEIISIATPVRQFHHQLVYLRLCADVDALSRLVEDQHRRLRHQPAAERHLLLVAARKCRDRAEYRGCFHAEPPRILRRDLFFLSESKIEPAKLGQFF